MNFDILNKKECLLDQKWSFQKNPKNRLFPKVHCFCQKIELFINYVFWANLARKDRFLIFWTKRNAFQIGKGTFQKSKKIEFFQRGQSMVFVEKSNFLSSLFFCKSSPTRSLLDILDKKVCFLDQKKEVLKMTKKLKFSKGVSPQFLSKNQNFFHVYRFGKSVKKRSFFDILQI